MKHPHSTTNVTNVVMRLSPANSLLCSFWKKRNQSQFQFIALNYVHVHETQVFEKYSFFISEFWLIFDVFLLYLWAIKWLLNSCIVKYRDPTTKL